MKTTIFSTILCLLTACCAAQTQTEMNDKAAGDFQKADKELNVIYQKVLKEYAADTAFIGYFKAAQKIWVQFRDAEMKAMYPEWAYLHSNVFPMCWNNYQAELTTERTRKLKRWLAGNEDDDVCQGSIKIRKQP